jgi:hypothetical protein
MNEIDLILDRKDMEIASLRLELAARDKTISELHTLLQKSDNLRQQYILRWLLSMKTPADRSDPLLPLGIP